MNSFETQYLKIMEDILDNGWKVPNRTGIDTIATWGQTMRIDLSEGFPILTTRKCSLKITVAETMFFLRGETDSKKLEDQKVNIWKGNTSREFLDKVGLHYLPEGHIGKTYSFQFRNYGGDYLKYPCGTPYNDFGDTHEVCTDYTKSVGGVDQIRTLLDGLKNDPFGRRHIVSAWNPAQISEMALPPCHVWNQYQVTPDGKLNSMFLMRSWDYAFGANYNITSYALLNIMFAKYLGLTPGILIAHGNDVHIYENQIPMCKAQIERVPYNLPTLKINRELNSFDDILSLEYSDFMLENYKSHPDFKDKPPMAI